jgi:hypothetical protein
LSTIVQPAASAGATLQATWLTGQFHGVRLDVLRAAAGLGTLRQAPGSAHFVHDCFGYLIVALRELCQNGFQ